MKEKVTYISAGFHLVPHSSVTLIVILSYEFLHALKQGDRSFFRHYCICSLELPKHTLSMLYLYSMYALSTLYLPFISDYQFPVLIGKTGKSS